MQETHLEFSVFSSFLISELEATEACRWLRATGFPQYAQMYEGKKIVFLGRMSRWLPSSSCVYHRNVDGVCCRIDLLIDCHSAPFMAFFFLSLLFAIDWQFPLDLNVVERDHPFLDVDSLQALFRRLATLNRMAKLRSEKARIRPQVHIKVV